MSRKRTKETAAEVLEDHNPFEPEEFQRRVEAKLGKGPYEFLDERDSIPIKFGGKKRRNLLPIKERKKNPQPNYSNFGKPEYIDDLGREYKLATGTVKQSLVETGEDTAQNFEKPELYSEDYIGTKAFFMRIPIDTRDQVPIPDAGFGTSPLQLFDIKTQVVCEGTIDSVFFHKRRKTGYMVMRDFATLGKSSDPSAWQQVIEGRKRRRDYL